MKQFVKTASIVATLALGAQQASAATIVDTGEGHGATWSFYSGQWFAGQFSIASDMTIDLIQAFLDVGVGGDISVRILGNAGYQPNATVFYDQSITAAVGEGWAGVSGISLELAAGTYWVEFQPDGASGYWGGGVANPLDEYAQNWGAGWQDLGQNVFDYLEVGVRIKGEPTISAVPLPAGGLLLISALGLGAAVRRRKAAA